METENLVSKINRQQYLAGVMIANGPVYIYNLYRDIIITNTSLLTFLMTIILIIFISSALSGYLIARKTGEIYQKAGITMGLLSYITYLIVSWLFGIGMLPFESAASLTFFVVGAAVGAKYYLYKNQ